jgi:glycosyltransferase involved in cell wall biosynthesis
MEFMTWDEGDYAEMMWQANDEHLVDCDILYYNKFMATDVSVLKEMKKINKNMKIVVDVDDSWDMPVNHPVYEIWKANNISQKVIDNIKFADLVICTTLKLQDKIREYNKNTVVIPNAFPFGHDVYRPLPAGKPDDGKTRFIYVAGSTHAPDVDLLEGKFKRLGGDPFIKSKGEFILAGYEKSETMRYHSRADMEKMNNNYTMKQVYGPWDRMKYVFSQTNAYKIFPSTNLDEYINFYDQADVALVPLCKNDWNSYKSELKIVEAGCKQVPVICSNVEPYSLLKGRPGIMWVDTPDDWVKHIRYCIKNPEFVKDQGAALAEWVKESYDLLKWNELRKQVLKSLVK